MGRRPGIGSVGAYLTGRYGAISRLAMPFVRMMKMAIYEEVNVSAMRHALVPAAVAVNVLSVMGAAPMIRRALVRMGAVDRDLMLADTVTLRIMQMPIVQVVEMIPVDHRDVSAAGAVVVVGMNLV